MPCCSGKGGGIKMSWENELAMELKQRDNIVPLGALEGKILSVKPFRVSVKDGKIILGPDQIHVSRSLLTKKYKSTGKGKMKLKGSGLGEIVLSGDKKNTDNLKWNDVEVEFEIEYDETYQLEVGQKVYVMPTTSEQIFFICDVIEER